MNRREVLTRLEDANPYPGPVHLRRERNRAMARVIAILAGGVLMLSGAAVGYAYVSNQPNVVTAWSGSAITGAAAADDAVISVHDESITGMLDTMQERYPLPPGVLPAKAYSILETTFPLAPGEDWPLLTADGPTNPYFVNLGFISESSELNANPVPAYVYARDLAGTVALLSANAWYQYWLTGTEQQRAEAAAVIAQTPQWADLVWRVSGGELATTELAGSSAPDRGRTIHENARAVSASDADHIREWFTNYGWNPKGFG